MQHVLVLVMLKRRLQGGVGGCHVAVMRRGYIPHVPAPQRHWSCMCEIIIWLHKASQDACRYLYSGILASTSHVWRSRSRGALSAGLFLKGITALMHKLNSQPSFARSLPVGFTRRYLSLSQVLDQALTEHSITALPSGMLLVISQQSWVSVGLS